MAKSTEPLTSGSRAMPASGSSRGWARGQESLPGGHGGGSRRVHPACGRDHESNANLEPIEVMVEFGEQPRQQVVNRDFYEGPGGQGGQPLEAREAGFPILPAPVAGAQIGHHGTPGSPPCGTIESMTNPHCGSQWRYQ